MHERDQKTCIKLVVSKFGIFGSKVKIRYFHDDLNCWLHDILDSNSTLMRFKTLHDTRFGCLEDSSNPQIGLREISKHIRNTEKKATFRLENADDFF